MESTIFATALGDCKISWTRLGFSEVTLLPQQTIKPLQELPEFVLQGVNLIQRHLAGELHSLRDLPLDLNGVTPFFQKVYRELRKVNPGKTTTYGDLAKKCGVPGGARAIGQAMRKNPMPLIIPCHRVLAANERLGGFSAYGGVSTKKKILSIEGLSFRE